MIFFFLTVIILTHVLVITKLIFFPYPELFIYPYLVNHGLKPYSQILDQHFPGLMFFPINFNNLGMTDPYVARIWLIVVVVVTQLLLFLVAKELFKSSKKAILVTILYFLWQPFFEGWVLWIDSFLPLFLLPAFYFSLKRKYLLVGVFLGLAITFKQTIVPLSIILFIYLILTKVTFFEIKNYLLGLIIPNLLMVVYFFSIGVFWDFWYWTVVFNLTTYAKYGTKAPIETGFITRILLVYLSSTLAFFHKERKTIFILFIFLLGSLISILDRADFIHLQPSLPFVLLATVSGISSIKSKKILGLLILVYLLITGWWQMIFYKGHLSNHVFFFDDQAYALANKIKKYTKPQDKIFVYGAAPHLYQMSNTLPAGDIFVFQFPWFLKIAESRILEGIRQDKPNIIISDREAVIEDQRITEFAKDIDQYIEQNYQQIDKVGTTSILLRKNL